MAIDNLNYYSNGLPAGQLTDKYSTQPGCLKSKNLDIFSSSKSVKATAWSTPVSVDSTGIVLVDQTGNLILRNDDKVYDRSSGEEVLVYTGVSANFPSYKISYNGKTGTYENAQWGTPRQLISKYENGVLKYFTIFTDRSRFSYSAVEYNTPDESWTTVDRTEISSGTFKKSSNNKRSRIQLRLSDIKGFSSATLFIQATNSQYASEGTLTIANIYFDKEKYRYNAETDQIEDRGGDNSDNLTITDQLDVPNNKTAQNTIPLIPDTGDAYIDIYFQVDPPSGSTDYTWTHGEVYMWVGNYDYFYSYLPVNESRELKPIGEYYWEKKTSFQLLYNWESDWANDDYYARVVRYNLEEYIGWANDVSMDVVGMISWNEQVYMIGNMNGNGYIIPCDLTGGRGTAYIAYGCEFKGATNIDYLLYLVGEDRGVSQLWVYNGQELVAILGGTEEKDTVDLIDYTEQYRFDGKMVEYRGDLVLSTSDNRIFQYGQTYGGKGGAFIHELPGTLTDLKVDGNDLVVGYSVTASGTTTKYLTTLQDDTPIKNYNTEWVVEYPIVIGNHLLEKEEADLYVSYILPSSTTSLEFWGNANHYTFWTFKTDGQTTPDVGSVWYIDGASNGLLIFVEKNGVYLTFKLMGDLPRMSSNGTNKIKRFGIHATGSIDFTEINHFRKIGEITTDKYVEGEFRFTNLNTKLDLPRSHSLQIMVKGKGTADYTPELFAVDLVANQRERG